MRTIVIKVNESDYQSMVEHFRRDRIGKPLVAVQEVVEYDTQECGDDFEQGVSDGMAEYAALLEQERR